MIVEPMTETEDWHVQRRRYEAFSATELGKLYRAYDKATINYWRRDMDDDISPAEVKALQERYREATNAFVAKLMEIAGV
jgi:bisphosphoglycerate-dependent phosphoglycerate mutase